VNSEDAKRVGYRVAKRIEAARITMLEDERGCLVRRRSNLEWSPILPGSLSLLIEGVEWTDDGDGVLIDGIGNEDGILDYSTGEFIFREGVGIEGSEEYVARYGYDVEEAERLAGAIDFSLESFSFVCDPDLQFRIRSEEFQ